MLVDKEADCGMHASGRNSGVLHAGFYYTADSLKSWFARTASRRTSLCASSPTACRSRTVTNSNSAPPDSPPGRHSTNSLPSGCWMCTSRQPTGANSSSPATPCPNQPRTRGCRRRCRRTVCHGWPASRTHSRVRRDRRRAGAEVLVVTSKGSRSHLAP